MTCLISATLASNCNPSRRALRASDLSRVVPEDVPEYITRHMMANRSPFGFTEFLDEIVRNNHFLTNIDLPYRLVLCFEMLDQFGYRPEKKRREDEQKARGALTDASHAGMASFTDVLITADDRFRDKARAAYRLFGVATSVLDAKAVERYLANR